MHVYIQNNGDLMKKFAILTTIITFSLSSIFSLAIVFDFWDVIWYLFDYNGLGLKSMLVISVVTMISWIIVGLNVITHQNSKSDDEPLM